MFGLHVNLITLCILSIISLFVGGFTGLLVSLVAIYLGTLFKPKTVWTISIPSFSSPFNYFSSLLPSGPFRGVSFPLAPLFLSSPSCPSCPLYFLFSLPFLSLLYVFRFPTLVFRAVALFASVSSFMPAFPLFYFICLFGSTILK